MIVYYLHRDQGYDGTVPIGVFSTRAKADHWRRGEIIKFIRTMRREQAARRLMRSYVKSLAFELVVLDFEIDRP